MPWLFRDSRKHDRLDAEKLAVLSYLDQVPRVHLPSPAVSGWRGLINERRQLVKKRTRAKNQVRALLRSNVLRCPHRSLWTQRGLAWLGGLDVDAMLGGRIGRLLAEIRFLNGQIASLERELDTLAADQPAVALLRTIPGIGPRTAEAIVAYVDEVERFSNRKQFASYFGVVPKEDSSGARVRRGRISKRGPSVVRWVLIEATHHALRRCPALRAYAARIARGRKDRRKKAIVATARKLLSICFGMLKTGEAFDVQRLRAASPAA
jgi:transposase